MGLHLFRLIIKNDAVRRKIVKKAHGLYRHIVYKGFSPSKAIFKPFHSFHDRCPYVFGRLGAVLFLIVFNGLCHILFHGKGCLLCRLFSKYYLLYGKYPQRFQPGKGPLAHNVKGPDGIHLIVPELYPDGALMHR